MSFSLESTSVQETPLLHSLRDDQLRVLFEMTLDAIAIVDNSGRYLDVNPATCHLLGLERQDLLGRSLGEFLEPDCDAARVWSTLPQAGRVEGEWRWVRPDGQTYRLHYTVAAHFLPQGHLVVMRNLRDRQPTEPSMDAQASPPGHADLDPSVDRDRPPVPDTDATRSQLSAITVQKENVVAAEETLRRLQLALKVANIGAWDWNPQTNQVTFSSQWKTILGYEDDEITNSLHEWESRVHPDDLPSVYAQIGRHLQGEISFYSTEHRLRCKDGTYKWIVDRGRIAARDAQGNPIQFIGINYDISARKAGELALEKLSQQLKKSQEVGRMGHWSLDLDTQNITWSEEVFRLVGRHPDAGEPSLEEYLGQLHPDDRPRLLERLAAAQTGVPQDFDYRIFHPDGKLRYIGAHIEPEMQGEDVVRLFGIIMDISDRKRQEQALRLIVEGTAAQTGEDFFKSCVQYLAQALDVRYAIIAKFIDAEELTATTLAFWAGDDFGENFTYKLTGAPCQQVGQPSEVRLYPHSVQCLFPEFGALAALQAESYAGLLIVDTAGNHLGLLVVMDTKPMVEDLAMQSDILRIFATRAGAEIERMRAEVAVRQSETQLRQQTQELEATLHKLKTTQIQLIQSEKMSSLGQLVAGIAHEINNPVGFIAGNLSHVSEYVDHLSQLIQLYRNTYPNPPQEILKLIADIDLDFVIQDLPNLFGSMSTGTSRIEGIVKSLRTFSRLDEADFKAVALHENIDSTLVILQNRLNGRAGNPRIQVIKQYNYLPLMACYSGLLNQVFMNLLVNAIDAIEERQKYEEKAIYTGCIVIAIAELASDRVEITIGDNGSGIPLAAQAKIFDPFFTTKSIGKGTGMGLSISYQIVTENHQGTLMFTSTPGVGTEFKIQLPLKI